MYIWICMLHVLSPSLWLMHWETHLYSPGQTQSVMIGSSWQVWGETHDEVVLAIQLVSPYCWWLNPMFCCLVFYHRFSWLNPTCSDLKSHEQNPVIMDFLAFFMDLTGGSSRRLPVAVPGQLGAKDDGKGHAGTQGLEAWGGPFFTVGSGFYSPNMVSSSDLRTMVIFDGFSHDLMGFCRFKRIQMGSNRIQ